MRNHFYEYRFEAFSNGDRDRDLLRFMFIVGREFQGTDRIWSLDNEEDDHVKSLKTDLVEFYLDTSHSARRAALQGFVVLRDNIIPKDVCRLVAQLVYNTRETEPEIWYWALQTETRAKKAKV